MPDGGKKRISPDARLSISQAADMLGVSGHTVRNWIKAGLVPATWAKNRFVLRLADIKKVNKKLERGGPNTKKRSRANKTADHTHKIPQEHLTRTSEADLIESIRTSATNTKLTHIQAIFATSLNLLIQSGLIRREEAIRLTRKNAFRIDNFFLKEELCDFRSTFPSGKEDAIISLLDLPLPQSEDCLGLLHQSFTRSGNRAQSGMFYTPMHVVNSIAKDLAPRVKAGVGVLDPCCGSGQFLVAFARHGVFPGDLFGLDIDPIAVRIARLNFFLAFPGLKLRPNILQRDSLLPSVDESIKTLGRFSIIATNPPWGARPNRAIRAKLGKEYPEITSGEYFSYFIRRALDHLTPDGAGSFILPESVLNIARHKDIRRVLLETTFIEKVKPLKRIFNDVFTGAVRIDFSVCDEPPGNKQRAKGFAVQKDWLANPGFIFSINSNSQDNRIIDKIFAQDHHTLAEKAEWALGIVTGDNKRFLSDKPGSGLEPVYRGRNIRPFIFTAPQTYIRFSPDIMQQSAPEKLYRTKGKLIYRFISRRLVFAYDNCGRLTLNSANLVIPGIEGYPMPAIAALFNSAPYQFIHEKLFFSLKVLRANLERLPLPTWLPGQLDRLSAMAEDIAEGVLPLSALDEMVMDSFMLTLDEKKRIRECVYA